MRHVVSSQNSTAPPSSSSPPASSAAAQKRRRGQRTGLLALLLLYGTALVAIGIADARGPERWIVSSFNLYLPQWLWALPGLILVGVSLRIAQRWTWFPLLCVIWVATTLMGFCWHIGPAAGAGGGKSRLRVMTYNIKYGQRDVAAFLKEIADTQPDLLLLQDVGDTMDGPLRLLLHGRNVRAFGQYVIASHLPLSEPQIRWISLLGEAQHTCLRCQLTVGRSRITVYDVHLLTPRAGLNAVKFQNGESLSVLEQNVAARLQQARLLAQALQQEQGALIVAGDFNAPDISLVCRTLRLTGLRDAFAEAGEGYGYTYGHMLRLRHSYMRLDHILVSPEWQVQGCWAGSAEGSDHRPVIADLVLLPGN